MNAIGERVKTHKNVENVIRYYITFIPPRGARNILDIGAGISMPYRGILSARTTIYKSLDIRQNPNLSKQIDYVLDLTEGTSFKKYEWHWGWCSEVLEHIPLKLKQKAFNEILRICRNVTFTFPTPLHKTFFDDIGHTEVKIDPLKVSTHLFYDKSTKSGRNIWIFTDPLVETIIPKGVGEIRQGDVCADDLPWIMVNYKKQMKPPIHKYW